MPRAPNECPRCRAYVTPFAAGCSVCGFDIERHRRGRRTVRFGAWRPSLQWDPELTRDTILTILLALVSLAAPLYGLLFSAMVAVDRHRRGHRLMRNVALACAVVAFLGLFVAYWPAGRAGPVAH